MKMQAAVAEVKRAFVSVHSVCEQGDKVVVGPTVSYIEHIDSGGRTYMERSGMGYRVKVWVPAGFTRPAKP